METDILPPDPFPIAEWSTVRVSIVYDDFTSGVRAKRFADGLAEQLQSDCSLSESLWRCDLLENPWFADQAARESAGCDYIIISLRGDRVLPFGVRQWIEGQLDAASEHGTWVIGLLGSYQGKHRVVDGNRHFLRCACEARGVNFFSLATITPTEPQVVARSDGSEAMALAAQPRPGFPSLLTA
ncbi:MAG: hypothetical protein P4L99_07565 [Chthoniobacter sp.]|nr:hypothetical protein [Chthoniobacter sp.]